MNINVTLLNEIMPHLYLYDCHPIEIEQFLTKESSFLERQHKAIQIIEGIMTVHGKEELFHHMVELARVEHGIRELEPWVRDHVVHAVLSFILGIYLNEKFLGPVIGTKVNKLQWKLAGLFHDVGYPAQVAKDILKPFVGTINRIKRKLGISTADVYFKIVPVGLENLTNGLNSFNLIQERLNGWGLQIDAKKEYDSMINSGRICHGIISSLAILYVIDLMYQKYNPERVSSDVYTETTNINWNQTYFECDVVSACSAIYVHNLPSRCFVRAQIDPLKTPVAFLLKLADCLQEWERPSLLRPLGFPTTRFDIETHNGQLIFSANIPRNKKNNMSRGISSCLANSDIRIC